MAQAESFAIKTYNSLDGELADHAEQAVAAAMRKAGYTVSRYPDGRHGVDMRMTHDDPLVVSPFYCEVEFRPDCLGERGVFKYDTVDIPFRKYHNLVNPNRQPHLYVVVGEFHRQFLYQWWAVLHPEAKKKYKTVRNRDTGDWFVSVPRDCWQQAYRADLKQVVKQDELFPPI